MTRQALHVALCRTEAEAQRRIGQAEAAAESDLRRAEAEAAEQAGRLAAAARREAESVAAAERLEAELRRVSERAAAALREAEQASARLEGRLKEAEAEAEASRAERAAVEARASQARREADAAVAQESGGWREERAYVRTLMIRYMELESEHEALFPAITPGHGAAHTRIHQYLRTRNQLGALPRHRHGAAFDARRGCEDPRRAGGARVGYLCVGAHGARRLLSLGRGERGGDGGVEIPHAAGRLVTPDGSDRSD